MKDSNSLACAFSLPNEKAGDPFFYLNTIDSSGLKANIVTKKKTIESAALKAKRMSLQIKECPSENLAAMENEIVNPKGTKIKEGDTHLVLS